MGLDPHPPGNRPPDITRSFRQVGLPGVTGPGGSINLADVPRLTMGYSDRGHWNRYEQIRTGDLHGFARFSVVISDEFFFDLPVRTEV